MAPRRPVLPNIRYIDPASIDVGDTIRASSVVGDLKIEKVGVVHRILFDGPIRVIVTRDGQEITRWQHGVKHDRITLLDKAPLPQPALFEWGTTTNLNERLA